MLCAVLKQWLPLTVGAVIKDEPEGYDNALLDAVIPHVPDSPLKTYSAQGSNYKRI